MPDSSYIDPEAGADRQDARLALLGTKHPRCSRPPCDECNPFALTGVHPNLLCAEHVAERDGRSWTEQSHTAAKANLPNDTVAIPANDHSVLTHDMQAAWPKATLRNPDGRPLLTAAAATRGWLDTLRLIIERTVGWVPAFLERLDAWLRTKLGDRWWDDFLNWKGGAS
jgi:hypothetical protein